MQMLYVPSYCGGKLLVGMYSSNAPWTADMYKDAVRFQNKLNGQDSYSNQLSYWGSNGNNDSDKAAFSKVSGRVPNTTEDFAYHLRALLGTVDNVVGTLTAVTNGSQRTAAKFLKECGFVEAAKTEKYEGYGYCITWVGDVNKKVLPTINKLIGEKYKPEVLGGEPAKKKKSLFASFASEDR